MKNKVKEAIQLRKKGAYRKALHMFKDILKNDPEDSSLINYQCAWTCDAMGREREAISFYKRALKNGLLGKNRHHAYVGLGSTYRVLGQYNNSANTIKKGLKEFPKSKVLRVFYAMCIYNLKKHHQAMQILLEDLIKISNDADVKAYRKAIQFYSKKLDKTW
ncbi:MAG: tetratricopeptide repeat protein [Deltaproteobacteria bacterium]|nr:tetratricopeptide repeat protein [Deltaproteobacteria bacterium]